MKMGWISALDKFAHNMVSKRYINEFAHLVSKINMNAYVVNIA